MGRNVALLFSRQRVRFPRDQLAEWARPNEFTGNKRDFCNVGSLLLDQLGSNLKCHLGGPGQASLGWCCKNPTPAVWPDLLTGN